MAYTYKVNYGPSATGPWTPFATGLTGTTDTITGLASSTSYYVQVIATDTTTNADSAPVVAGPYMTAAAAQGESLPGTVVNTTSETIFASRTPGTASTGPFDLWTISGPPGPNCQAVRNSVTDTTTSSLLELYYSNHTVYQEASNGNELGVTPGWWSWNGTTWVASQNPVPVISITAIATQSTGNAFTISGTLSNYSSAPTLQYQDNSANLINLPSGNTVTQTSFSFTHPAVSATTGSMTVTIKDQIGTTATSNSFAVVVPGQVNITGISLSSKTFTSGASSGTVVGQISVQTTTAAFSGTLTITGTNASSFAVSGNNLVTVGVLTGSSYSINIVATMTGAVGSPFTQAETITPTAVGPAVNSNFLTVDFSSSTGLPNGSQTVSQYVWGVATGNMGGVSGSPNFPGFAANPSLQAVILPLAFTFLRVNSQIGAMEAAFPGGATTASNATINQYWGNLVNNFTLFFPSTTRLVIGLGDQPQEHWSTPQNFANACTVLATYLLNTKSTVTGLPVPIWGWEFSNESNTAIYPFFTAGAQAVKAVNPNWKVCGPVFNWSHDLQSFAQNCGSVTDVIDYHAYEYETAGDWANHGSSTAARVSWLLGGANGLGGINGSPGRQDWINGGGSPTAPFLLGEYNQNGQWGDISGDGPNPGPYNIYMVNSVGAVFNANFILSGLNADIYFEMAGIWDILQDTDYGLVQATDVAGSQIGGVSPGGRFLSKAGLTCYGTRAAVPTNNSGCNILACSQKPIISNCGVLLINANQSNNQQGQIALSHWPSGNSAGNGTINRYEVSPGNPNGSLTQLTVTGGLVTTTIPAQSVVILYS